jgi:hypothetical protein
MKRTFGKPANGCFVVHDEHTDVMFASPSHRTGRLSLRFAAKSRLFVPMSRALVECMRSGRQINKLLGMLGGSQMLPSLSMCRNGTGRSAKATITEGFVLSGEEQILRPQPLMTQPPALPPPPLLLVCPKCGSHRTRLVDQSPESLGTYRYRCDDCWRLFACRIGIG